LAHPPAVVIIVLHGSSNKLGIFPIAPKL